MIKDIEPVAVFKFFSEISNIPRESEHEQKICKYIIDFAKGHGFEFYTDKMMNVIIKKKGQSFSGKCEPVILQSHMDMVCVKNPESNHNFKTDPLDLYSDSKFVMAKDTSLGADDGIGMAIMLAILDDKNISHPDLECVFTSDEEINLSGAQSLDKTLLSGKMMINLDNETFGQICVSSAGGIMSDLHLPINFINTPKNFSSFILNITGLNGGHSGIEINKELANANILCGRFLHLLNGQVLIKNITGGESDSYIANHAQIEFAIPENFLPNLFDIFTDFKNEIEHEFLYTEKNMKLELKKADNFKIVIDKPCTEKIIFALMTIPNGVIAMNTDNKGLVETSNNLGKVEVIENEVIFTSLSRSMYDSKKYYIANIIQCIADKIGGYIEYTGDFPGWSYNKNSILQKFIQHEFIKLGYGIMHVEAIHAGLECGYFATDNNLDIVSIGPNIFGCHTINEKLDIESVQKLWKLIINLFAKLNLRN